MRLATLGEGIGDGTQSPDTRRRVLRSEVLSVAASALTPALSLWEKEHIRAPLPGDPKGVGGEGQMAAVIEAFGKQRLLSFDRDPVTRGPTVEVAHEALLREWPRLQGWLSVSRTDVRLQRQLAAAALEWQNANRDAGFLLAGSRLAQFEGWAAGHRCGAHSS